MPLEKMRAGKLSQMLPRGELEAGQVQSKPRGKLWLSVARALTCEGGRSGELKSISLYTFQKKSLGRSPASHPVYSISQIWEGLGLRGPKSTQSTRCNLRYARMRCGSCRQCPVPLPWL